MAHINRMIKLLALPTILALFMCSALPASAGGPSPKKKTYTVQIKNKSGYKLSISKGYYNFSGSGIGGQTTFITNESIGSGESRDFTYKLREDYDLDVLQVFLRPIISGENGNNIIRLTTSKKQNAFFQIDTRQINA